MLVSIGRRAAIYLEAMIFLWNRAGRGLARRAFRPFTIGLSMLRVGAP